LVTVEAQQTTLAPDQWLAMPPLGLGPDHDEPDGKCLLQCYRLGWEDFRFREADMRAKAVLGIGRLGGWAMALGIGMGLFAGQGVAQADDQPADRPAVGQSRSAAHASATSRPLRRPAFAANLRDAATPKSVAPESATGAIARIRTDSERPGALQATTGTANVGQPDADGDPLPTSLTVSIALPSMPVSAGSSFKVSPDFMAGFAADYLAAGGDPEDSARFFLGDLAVASLDGLAAKDLTVERQRLLLGNLAASGYFGGIWLRDNLRDGGSPTPATAVGTVSATAAPILGGLDLSPSAIALRLFDTLAAGLTDAAANNSWLVRTAAHATVPLLLTLYGYNKGYLEVVLENPPVGVASMQETLQCTGFLDCSSTAFPLQMATDFDAVLDKLQTPTNLAWREMAAWSGLLAGVTGAGRSVWESGLQNRGGFSAASYTALVELSSAYLMVTKAAVLSGMQAYADGDADVGRSSLRTQAGLWLWSGSYFAGLAAGAPFGTMPAITAPFGTMPAITAPFGAMPAITAP
jgi:hypothetical protein